MKKVYFVKNNFVVSVFEDEEQAKIYANHLAGISNQSEVFELYVFKTADELIKRESNNV